MMECNDIHFRQGEQEPWEALRILVGQMVQGWGLLKLRSLISP